jgi:hypothetical protein
LCSRMQKIPVLFPTGGRITIPSGRNRQNLSFPTSSLDWSSWTLLLSSCVKGHYISRSLTVFHFVSCERVRYWMTSISECISFHCVWRHFSPEIHRNFHSGAVNRASSPCISRQHWCWASMWSADRSSQVCWIWPKVGSGRSFSVLNRSSDIQRALQRPHLSDSFFFVIRWIQALDGNVWEFACSILLWSCDLTEVSFQNLTWLQGSTLIHELSTRFSGYSWLWVRRNPGESMESHRQDPSGQMKIFFTFSMFWPDGPAHLEFSVLHSPTGKKEKHIWDPTTTVQPT